MTVVEKIRKLQDRLICLRCYGKSHETAAEERKLVDELAQIRNTCPTSWEAAKVRR